MGIFNRGNSDNVKIHGILIGPGSNRTPEEIAADEHPKHCTYTGGLRGKRCTDDKMPGFATCRKHQNK